MCVYIIYIHVYVYVYTYIYSSLPYHFFLVVRYRNPPLYVTENGWSTRGDETLASGVADGSRVLFLANYTSELRRAIYEVNIVCVCSVWVPCVALPSGGGSSVGSSPLCGSPVGGVPLLSCPRTLCGIYSRDVSRSCTRSRSNK